MKLINLTISAFGPFAKTQTVDFTSLGDNPLFLIDGPTGAGKSSVLHAICYALYGETTDEARKEQGIRSDHASDDTLTSVGLEFAIKDKRYRITRTPSQMRAGKRGDKLVKHNATAELLQLLDDGTEQLLVAKKKKDADEYILQIVGLSVDQFRQVMVLPQGKFRELLLANSSDRQAILSTLFATDIYQKIETQIKERALQIERQYSQFKSKIDETLSEVLVDSNEQLQEKIVQQQQLCEQQQQAKHIEDANRQLCLGQYKDGESLSKQFQLHAIATEKLTAIESQREAMQALAQKIELALTAQKIKPQLQALDQLKADVQQIETQKKVWLNEQLELNKQHQHATQQWQSAKQQLQQRDEILHRIAGLKSLLPVQQSFAQTQQYYQDHDKALQDAQLLLQSKQQEHKSIAERSEKGRLLIEQSQQQLGQQNELMLELKNLQQQAILLDERDQLNQKLIRTQNDLTQAQQAYQQQYRLWQQAEQHYHQQASHYHANQAAVLAAQLEINQPCPVCGSAVHPAPCQASGDNSVDQATLEQAQTAWQQQQQRLAKSDTNQQQQQLLSQQLEQRIAQINQQLKEQFADRFSADRVEVRQHVSRLELRIQELTTVADNIKKWQINQQKMSESLAPLAQNIEQLNQQLPTLVAAKASAQQALQQASETLAEKYRTAGVLEAEIAELTAQIAQLEQTHDETEKAVQALLQQVTAINAHIDQGKQNIATVSARLNTQQQVWLAALEQHGFANEQAFKVVELDEQQVAALQQQLTQHKEQRQQIKGQISALAQQLEDKQQPNLDALQQKLDLAQQNLIAAEQLLSQTTMQHNRLRDAQRKISAIEDQQSDNKRQYEVIGNLALAASGRGNVRVSLERFVLADLLDSVLAIASKRLHLMSRGQYQLIRQDESAQKRNVTAGLDLAVFDSYSSKARPVATLSGGESFMASLALALALSDVVQQRSGGIVLDTLFIDEGFGSLDQDSLQLAIQTLVDLQATGRTIGIISHVSELKEQMAKRIDVKSQRDGSAISMTV
ncbi:SMC family ATPase [Thalassotalea sp. HSM 43]|uniref:AAA family ATPase n=1 Tax=Thalassotalea sp. HSM 43 TaxID=2552945 RepID=UPI00107FF767|nr:SMC family ATPase [Thalassotalea sp. HSM 43]QBY05555.1 SMC family ATPase [Thalassotalea sp. HSM 43]